MLQVAKISRSHGMSARKNCLCLTVNQLLRGILIGVAVVTPKCARIAAVRAVVVRKSDVVASEQVLATRCVPSNLSMTVILYGFRSWYDSHLIAESRSIFNET